MSEKEYVVIVKADVDLEAFDAEVAADTGSGQIPNRAVTVANPRIGSKRMTHWMLTDEEASTLQNDERVLSVEIPPEQKPEINKQLDAITDYVFEVLQNSNFNQEIHESFMDLAVGTGCMLVEEGDSVNPIKFTAVPLPKICLMNGPDGRIDTVYRKRSVKPEHIKVLYPKAVIPENFDPLRIILISLHCSKNLMSCCISFNFNPLSTS